MKTELVTTLKRQATRIIEDLRTNRDPVMITEHGKPAAYLVDVETFEAKEIKIGNKGTFKPYGVDDKVKDEK